MRKFASHVSPIEGRWPKFVQAIEAASGRLSTAIVWRTAEEAVVAHQIDRPHRELAPRVPGHPSSRRTGWALSFWSCATGVFYRMTPS